MGHALLFHYGENMINPVGFAVLYFQRNPLEHFWTVGQNALGEAESIRNVYRKAAKSMGVNCSCAEEPLTQGAKASDDSFRLVSTLSR